MRVAFNIAIAFSLLCLPWYIGVVLLIVACFTVRNFYEAVVYGIIADALYSTSFGFHGFPYVATAFAAIALLFSVFMRDKLSW